MAKHTLMEGVRAAISTVSRVCVIADKVTEVAEVSVDNWISALEQEREQLAREIAAAQQSQS